MQKTQTIETCEFEMQTEQLITLTEKKLQTDAIETTNFNQQTERNEAKNEYCQTLVLETCEVSCQTEEPEIKDLEIAFSIIDMKIVSAP